MANSNVVPSVCQAVPPASLTIIYRSQQFRLKWERSKEKYRLHLHHLPKCRDTYYGPDPEDAKRQALDRLPSLLALAEPAALTDETPKHVFCPHKGVEYKLTRHKTGQYRWRDKWFGNTPATARADFYARIDGILNGADPRFTPIESGFRDEDNLSFNTIVDDALAYRKSRVGIDLGEDRYYNLEKRFGKLKECAAKVETQLPNARQVRYLSQTAVSDLKEKHLQDLIERLREIHNLTTLDDDLQFLRFILGRANRRLKSDTIDLIIKETLASVPQEKKRTEQKKNQKWYTREEILALHQKADSQWKAMILLGINGGMEPIEISLLDWSYADLELGWFGKARSKIGERAPRLFWYWPETVDALAVQPTRLKGGRVFLTSRGEPWIKGKKRSFQNEWNDLEEDAGVAHIKGRGFKGLRHSFNTFADKCRVKQDFCLRLIMGHTQKNNDMGRVYNGQSDDFLIRHYCEFVREWLFHGETAAHKLTKKWQSHEGRAWMDMQFSGVA